MRYGWLPCPWCSHGQQARTRTTAALAAWSCCPRAPRRQRRSARIVANWRQKTCSMRWWMAIMHADFASGNPRMNLIRHNWFCPRFWLGFLYCHDIAHTCFTKPCRTIPYHTMPYHDLTIYCIRCITARYGMSHDITIPYIKCVIVLHTCNTSHYGGCIAIITWIALLRYIRHAQWQSAYAHDARYRKHRHCTHYIRLKEYMHAMDCIRLRA